MWMVVALLAPAGNGERLLTVREMADGARRTILVFWSETRKGRWFVVCRVRGDGGEREFASVSAGFIGE